VTEGELVLMWQSADEPGRVELVVSSFLAEDLLALLAAAGVSAVPSRRPRRGAGVDVLTTVEAVAGNPAAWAAIGLVVKKFFDRHKGKRIRVGEGGLEEAENYSAGDIERIVRALSATDRSATDSTGVEHADSESG